MKVLYIANIRLPTEKAHGIQIMKTCEALAKIGHQVTLVVTNRKSGINDDVFSYYKVQKSFSIIKSYSPELLHFGKIGFMIMSFVFAQTSSRFVWKIKPDIVYSRDYSVLLNQWLWPQKKIWEVHDGLWNFLIRLAKIDGIVAISNGLRDFYERRGKKNIVVARDAVDLSEFEVSGKSGLDLPRDKKIAMYIGHLYGWKGANTFLEASRILKDVQFVVIGGTDKELVDLKGNYPNVIFAGYRPYNELPLHQKRADVLVIPNSAKSDISKHYTSPLKVFAYMTSGVPIVASDLPSIREVLNEENAYFAKPDDPQSFADVIKKALEEGGESIKKAENAKRDVRMYTWDNRAKIIADFLYGCLNGI